MMHLVRNKFKTVDSETESRLKELNANNIDELSVRLFSMQALDELVRWLDEYNGNS